MARKRDGAYRQSFFCSADWDPWLAELWPRFQTLVAAHHAGRLRGAEITADFLLSIWQIARPRRWSNGPRAHDLTSSEKSQWHPSLVTIATTKLRGLPPEAQDVLVEWQRERLPLELHFTIPSADEVLRAQCQGRRCVSVLIQHRDEFLAGGEHRDSFSFALHDLLHAAHFYRDPVHFRRQVHFSHWMSDFINRPAARERRGRDPAFAERLEYLFADMNTHFVHSVKCLKSLLRDEPLLESECLSAAGLFQSDDRFTAVWRELNTPLESHETHRSLLTCLPEDACPTPS